MKLSDEYLMTVINKLDGIGEVPWLIQKEMARELLELRQGKIGFWGKAAAKLSNDNSDLRRRLTAAEKVINLLRDDPTWEQAEAIEAYDKVVKNEKDNG